MTLSQSCTYPRYRCPVRLRLPHTGTAISRSWIRVSACGSLVTCLLQWIWEGKIKSKDGFLSPAVLGVCAPNSTTAGLAKPYSSCLTCTYRALHQVRGDLDIRGQPWLHKAADGCLLAGETEPAMSIPHNGRRWRFDCTILASRRTVSIRFAELGAMGTKSSPYTRPCCTCDTWKPCPEHSFPPCRCNCPWTYLPYSTSCRPWRGIAA